MEANPLHAREVHVRALREIDATTKGGIVATFFTFRVATGFVTGISRGMQVRIALYHDSQHGFGKVNGIDSGRLQYRWLIGTGLAAFGAELDSVTTLPNEGRQSRLIVVIDRAKAVGLVTQGATISGNVMFPGKVVVEELCTIDTAIIKLLITGTLNVDNVQGSGQYDESDLEVSHGEEERRDETEAQ